MDSKSCCRLAPVIWTALQCSLCLDSWIKNLYVCSLLMLKQSKKETHGKKNSRIIYCMILKEKSTGGRYNDKIKMLATSNKWKLLKSSYDD